MEQQQNSIANKPIVQPTLGPQIISEELQKNYFARLFSGRLNRQNYVIGSTFLVLMPLVCFLIVVFNILLSPTAFTMPYIDPNNPSEIITPHISVMSLVTTPANEAWSVAGILSMIISLPYLLSIQIRRLHDMNLNGWLWVINILPLFFIKSIFSLSEFSHPDIWYWISNFVSLASAVFSIYVTVWPGTKGTNKYGDAPSTGSNFLKEVLEIT